MQQLEESLRRYTIVLQICLILFAGYFLSIDINRPLANYDEATYAKVVVDTLESGDVLSFTLSSDDWYEKPPLYLWLAMGSVKIFGEHEFAFRIPSILASLLCLWLIYLIVRELTKSELAAVVAFLVLLSASTFLYFAKEVRLDSSVIAAILAAFWCWIKAWQNEKYLFWILPLAAVGFLFKSVIVFLLGLILLIYSLFYQRWAWLKSKYLWTGLPLALVIFIPWHAVQFSRFGDEFLNRYFGYDVYKRATTMVTGDGNYYDYIWYLWTYAKVWLFALIGTITLFIFSLFSQKMRSPLVWKPITASLAAFLSILILFSVAKTHLLPYLMPMFPFVAIFIGLLFYYVTKVFDRRWYISLFIALPLIISGVYYIFSPYSRAVLPDIPDEVNIGQTYKKLNTDSAPLYTLEWPFLETMNYYGGVKTEFLSAATMSGKELKGPFYLVITDIGAGYFYHIENKSIFSPYSNLRLLYQGHFLALIYFDSVIRFPIFSVPQ